MKTQESFCGSTNKSQLNYSTAKACYSFSKGSRLPHIKHGSDLMYELPSMLEKRSTSIGFGKKSDICPANFSPSPDKYEKPSDFDQSPKKGCSFGISRDSFKAVSIFNRNSNPGPGQYDDQPLKFKQNSRSFIMRGRDGFPEVFKAGLAPGPGQYEIKQETDKQFFFNSKRKSPQIYTIKKAKQNKQKCSNLSPASYQTSLASMGRQILATKKTETAFCFPKQTRDTMPISKSSVGPGSYANFSEFGK